MSTAPAGKEESSGGSKGRKNFLGLRSLVRSISSNGLAASFNSKPKKQSSTPQSATVPATPYSPPPPEEKTRRRASSFWAKKPKAPFYGDSTDLRHMSADALASTLRDSWRAIGFQDNNAYDNPAMHSNTVSSRASSRLSTHPYATPNMPTIIFSGTPVSSARNSPIPFAPSPLSSPAAHSAASGPATPLDAELRFDVPAYIPQAPQNRQSTMSRFSSPQGTPRTGSIISLPQHRGSTALSNHSSSLRESNTGSWLHTGEAAQGSSPTSSTFSSEQLQPPSPASPRLQGPDSVVQSPESSSAYVHAAGGPASTVAAQNNSTADVRTITQAEVNGDDDDLPLARPRVLSAAAERPFSTATAASEATITGGALRNIINGLEEVDNQLHEMLAQRGKELSKAVGPSEEDASRFERTSKSSLESTPRHAVAI